MEINEVNAGATVLDSRLPGWDNFIVVEHLDIDSTRTCVLGQLAEELAGDGFDPDWSRYANGVYALFGRDAAAYGEEVREHGFYPGEYSTRELTEAWRQLILERRGETVS